MAAFLRLLYSSAILALVVFSAVIKAEDDETPLNDAEEAALTDLLARGRVAPIGADGDVKPTFLPKRYVSKHQAFRFGKRLADNGLMLADFSDGKDISSLVGGAGDQISVGAGGDANLNKYLNKFLEKHKTSGIFRWGRK